MLAVVKSPCIMPDECSAAIALPDAMAPGLPRLGLFDAWIPSSFFIIMAYLVTKRGLGALHSSGIIHGDFTTANILIKSDGISVIDFGLSYYSSSAEDMAFDVLLFKRSVSEEDFHAFERAYESGFAKAREVLKKLAEIEMRGRYQNRSLETA